MDGLKKLSPSMDGLILAQSRGTLEEAGGLADRANVIRGHGYVLLELCFMFRDLLLAEISLVRQDICPFASLILCYDRALVGCRQHATWSKRWPRTIIGTSRRFSASFL